MSNKLFMHDFGPMLIENGYNIIPVVQGTKRPALANWPKIKATPELIESWDADASIGITTGEVVAIDIDCYDKHVTNAIFKYCNHNIGRGLGRIGRAPKALLLFRTDTPMAKSVSPKYMDEDGNVNCVEILGKGQQLVAYGIHPDTQQEYYWPKDCPTTVPISDLPTISAEQITELFMFFDGSTPAKWKRISHGALSPQPQPRTQPTANQDNVLNFEHMKSTLDLTDEAINRHLDRVSAEDYSQWILVGQALHHQFNGDSDGLEKWDLWSSKAANYKDWEECRDKWETFETIHDGGTVTFATVIDMAKKASAKELLAEAVDQANTLAFVPVGKIDAYSLPVREWVVGRRLQRGFITAMFAPGGVSKSMFSLLSAFSVASGESYTGESLHRQGKVWIINNEDDESEQLRRLAGIAKHHEIDDSVLNSISLSCGYGNPYVTSTVDKDGNVAHHPNAKKIIAEAKANNVNYIIIDPFISIHQSDENDNNSIQKAVDVLKHIAKEANVAIELVHHTRKAAGGKESEEHAGNADAGRGASSLKDACRVVTTLARMSKKTAKELSIDYEEEGRLLVRLDIGKGNYSGPPESASWFKQVSVDIGNGDTVGVHEVFDMTDIEALVASEKAQKQKDQVRRCLSSICAVINDDRTKQVDVIKLLVKQGDLKGTAWEARVREALPLNTKRYAFAEDGNEYWLTRSKKGDNTSSIVIDKLLAR